MQIAGDSGIEMENEDRYKTDFGSHHGSSDFKNAFCATQRPWHISTSCGRNIFEDKLGICLSVLRRSIHTILKCRQTYITCLHIIDSYSKLASYWLLGNVTSFAEWFFILSFSWVQGNWNRLTILLSQFATSTATARHQNWVENIPRLIQCIPAVCP